MSTKYSKAPRVRIPKDIQLGDILVLRDGQRRGWEHWEDDGLSRCDGCDPGGHYPDGRWWGMKENEFRPHMWDVVAIERKITQAVGVPKKLHPDKDAALMLEMSVALKPLLGPYKVRRLRAIAKRLNGGVAP